MSQAALCREARGSQRHPGMNVEILDVWGATEWSNLPGTWKMMKIEEWFRNIKATQEWNFAKFAWWILPDHNGLIYPGPKSGIWMSLIELYGLLGSPLWEVPPRCFFPERGLSCRKDQIIVHTFNWKMVKGRWAAPEKMPSVTFPIFLMLKWRILWSSLSFLHFRVFLELHAEMSYFGLIQLQLLPWQVQGEMRF